MLAGHPQGMARPFDGSMTNNSKRASFTPFPPSLCSQNTKRKPELIRHPRKVIIFQLGSRAPG